MGYEDCLVLHVYTAQLNASLPVLVWFHGGGLASGRISGNQGLRDQVLALQWVQENIVHLGGNPEEVAIWGESAGAWSVFHHLLAPQSNGLFRAGLANSGTMISGLADRSMTREEAAENGKEFAIAAYCHQRQETWQPEKVEQCLRTQTAEEIFEAYDKGTFRSRGSVDNFSDFPPMMPDLPETLLAEGKFNKVPILVR